MKLVIHSLLIGIFLLLSTNNIGYAQQQEWLPDGTTWHYNTTGWAVEYGTQQKYTIEGDSLIHGKTCKKLITPFMTCNERPRINYLYKENDQLYFYEADIDSFKLLFDFTLNVGDTFTLPSWGTMTDSWQHESLLITIDSISSFIMGSDTLKAFHYFPEPTFESRIIEDIGSDQAFFHIGSTGACGDESEHGLNCFTHPTYGLFEFRSNSPCSVGIETDQPKMNVQIYPNPTSHHIQIDVPPTSNITRTVIYDNKGSIWFEKRGFPDTSITTDQLPVGLYFVKLTQLDGTYFVEKFIKE